MLKYQVPGVNIKCVRECTIRTSKFLYSNISVSYPTQESGRILIRSSSSRSSSRLSSRRSRSSSSIICPRAVKHVEINLSFCHKPFAISKTEQQAPSVCYKYWSEFFTAYLLEKPRRLLGLVFCPKENWKNPTFLTPITARKGGKMANCSHEVAQQLTIGTPSTLLSYTYSANTSQYQYNLEWCFLWKIYYALFNCTH